MSRLTLADVAARAGVTVPTVSKVLNGREDVSAATRARVLLELDAAGYERRPSDRADNRHRTAGLVYLVMNPVGKSWAAEVLLGTTAGALRSNCEVVATYADQGDGDWAARAITRGARGVIVERWAVSDHQAARLAAARIPCVIIDPGEPAPVGVFSISATNWSGGYTAAQHLASIGHTRIALVTGGTDRLASLARADGFRSGIRDAGLELQPEWEAHADWTRAGGRAAARTLLELREAPSAIFACSDRMASGVYEAASEKGIVIPDELSVVGFDDLPEVRWLRPGLTTIHQPVNEMCQTALQIILEQGLSTATPEMHRMELSTSLVVRDSTSAPR